MTFDNLSDDDLTMMRIVVYAFVYGFEPAIDIRGSFVFDRVYLENIYYKVVCAENSLSKSEEKFEDPDLVCDLLQSQWWAFDPRHIGSLREDEVKVIIKSLQKLCQTFDGDVCAIIGSYSDIYALKCKLEALLIIKDYMLLQWSEFKYYRHIHDYASPLNLKFLIYFFATEYTPWNDYRIYDKEILNRSISDYDGNFVYNDFENKKLYIGCAEWEFDEIIKVPTIEEFPSYVNEINSCKISYDNFRELADKMIKLKRNPAPFTAIYRDNSDWIRCKGYSFKEELELFPENY